jgi:hypothetical protein
LLYAGEPRGYDRGCVIELPVLDFRDPDGKFVVKGSLTQSEVGPNFGALVPIYADFEGRPVLIGRIRMVGSSTLPEMTFKLPEKPRRILINARYDILARK